MKQKFTLIGIGLIFLMSAYAQAQVRPYLYWYSTATKTLSPNIAFIRVTYQSQQDIQTGALNEFKDKENLVINGLTDCGISKGDIQILKPTIVLKNTYSKPPEYLINGEIWAIIARGNLNPVAINQQLIKIIDKIGKYASLESPKSYGKELVGYSYIGIRKFEKDLENRAIKMAEDQLKVIAKRMNVTLGGIYYYNGSLSTYCNQVNLSAYSTNSNMRELKIGITTFNGPVFTDYNDFQVEYKVSLGRFLVEK